MPAGEPLTILKAVDRCDWPACGARAYVRAVFPRGAIDSCVHHWNEAPAGFLDKALYVIDESWNL
jgi:hypothetical protein